MIFYSLNDLNHSASFEEAVNNGLAPDKGLYFPKYIPKIPNRFINNILKYEFKDLVFNIIYPYVKNSIDKKSIRNIIDNTINFSFPIIHIEDNIYVLELFHGPTLAFKDVGAAFMSGCLNFFQKKKSQPITILVATSGDTGGAVANGFYKSPFINVVILYPSGKVSNLQEKQLTTLGDNIDALEIEGNFDDCQKLVKTAFFDKELKKKIFLNSANSINLARLLPQMFYYFSAYRSIIKLKLNKKIIFSIPSGNFGNLCSAMLAEKMGLPINHFIASTNINDTIPRFMKSGIYKPKTSKSTISNAMDVSDPSNFMRIIKLYPDLKILRKKMSSYSFTDLKTIKAIEKIFEKKNYILDPHGAISYLGIKKYLKNKNNNYVGIFLETAHPVKFMDKIPKKITEKIIIPNSIKNIMKKNIKSKKLPNNYKIFKSYLIDNIKYK